MNKSSSICSETKLKEGWKTTVARDFHQIEAIRPIWEKMQDREPYPVPNADINQYLSVIKASGDDLWPYVVLIEDNGRPMAMIIGWIAKHQLTIRLGYTTLLSPRLRCLTVVYGGILGQPEREFCSLLVSELMKQCRDQGLDMLHFNHLRTDTCLHQAIRRMPSLFCSGHFPHVEPHWIMPVPENISLFYQSCSPKTRNTLRRKIKKLEREFADQIKIFDYCDEDDLKEAVNIASKISIRTYQHGLGAGFSNDDRTYNMMATAASQGWFRMSVLSVKGEPCAFQLGYHYGKTYFLGQLAFDPQWKHWNVGTFLFIKVLEDLCRDTSVQTFDFGFGDAQYKMAYGDQYWNEASISVFAPQLYPVLINMLRTSVTALNSALEYAVNKTGIADRIKRYWRNRLEGKAAEEEC